MQDIPEEVANILKLTDIGQLIGNGSFGHVFPACHTELSTDAIIWSRVAVKWIKDKPDALREIDIGNYLSGSPHCIQIIDSLVTNDNVFIVFELAKMDLLQMIQDSPHDQRTTNDFLYITKQLIEAIRHLHEYGIMHRDIKPANILIMNEHLPRIKLGDFGSATFVLDYNETTVKCITSPINDTYMTPGDQCCTVSYQSPEMLLGLPWYHCDVDVWSMACIVFEMFIRRRLFWCNDVNSLFEKICDTIGCPDLEAKSYFKNEMDSHKSPYKQSNVYNNMCKYQYDDDNFIELNGLFNKIKRKISTHCMVDTIESLISFLKSIFVWNPNKRLKYCDTLTDPFYKNLSSMFQ